MATQPWLQSYDKFLVGFSGGADCLAALLLLKEAGVRMDRVELHHHDVDGGDGEAFMDWECTPGYCAAVAEYLGVPIYFSWREGGIKAEVLKCDTPTAAIRFETPEGPVQHAGGTGSPRTRRMWPAKAADLRVRYCSGLAKIDVMDAVIRGQERFNDCRTLVITGERAEESTNRARYATFEPHRSDARSGLRLHRHVDHWRPVHGLLKQGIWAIIQRHGIVPHVSYQLGWGRLSCMCCIFASPSQWATILLVFPDRFEMIEMTEQEIGHTISHQRSKGRVVPVTVREMASRGMPYAAAVDRPDLVAQARSLFWTLPIHVSPEAWQLPAGAYGEKAGPS